MKLEDLDKGYLKIGLLVIVLLFCVYSVYKVHYKYSYYNSYEYYCSNCTEPAVSYQYPVHADEWTHLAQGVYFMDSGRIPAVNPYVGVPHTDMESGFHAFIAQFFTLTGLDPVLNYKLLPSILIILIVLSLVALMESLTGSIYPGLLAALFLVSVRNNINIMGVWFFLPLTFGIFMLIMFYYLYSKKLLLLAALFYTLSIFVYPIVTILLTFSLLLDVIFNKNNALGIDISKIKDAIKPSMDKGFLQIAIFAVLFIFACIMLYLLMHGSLGTLLEFLVFKYGWTKNFEVEYVLWSLYFWPALILALFGLYVVLQKYSRMFLYWPLFAVIPVITYTLFKLSIFMPYQRAIVYFLIGLAPLSAIGLYWIFKYLYKHVSRISRFFAICAVAILTLVLFYFAFQGYQRVELTAFKPYYLIDNNDYVALRFATIVYGSNQTIVTPWDAAFTVYPITGMRTPAVPDSNLGYGDINKMMQVYVPGIDCTSIYTMLKQLGATLFYSRSPISCSNIQLVYSGTDSYLYTVH